MSIEQKTGQAGQAAGTTVTGQYEIGRGGELHQVAGGTHPAMTTQFGVAIGDDENQLKGGERGPTLLEDFKLHREDAAL